VAIVQSNYQNSTSGGLSTTIALSGSATPGNAIILVVGWTDFTGSGVMPTPTDANGTYQIAFSPNNNAEEDGLSIFYVPNCGSGTHATTMSGYSGFATFWSTAAIYEVSGLLSSPLDKVSPGGSTVGGGASQTSQSTGSTGTLSQANEWALTACEFDSSTGQANQMLTVPTGWTTDPNIPSTFQDTITNLGLQVGWMTTAATTALSGTFNWPSDPTFTSSFAVIATFENGAAPPPANQPLGGFRPIHIYGGR
jgi:hypothetical protein